MLRRSNIEPPVLAELFAKLESLGMPLGHPLSVEEAARAIERWAGRAPGAPGAGVPPVPVAGVRPAPDPAVPPASGAGARPEDGA
jgi:hypothetical protein